MNKEIPFIKTLEGFVFLFQKYMYITTIYPGTLAKCFVLNDCTF